MQAMFLMPCFCVVIRLVERGHVCYLDTHLPIHVCMQVFRSSMPTSVVFAALTLSHPKTLSSTYTHVTIWLKPLLVSLPQCHNANYIPV